MCSLVTCNGAVLQIILIVTKNPCCPIANAMSKGLCKDCDCDIQSLDFIKANRSHSEYIFIWGIFRFHFIIITFQRHRCFVGFYLPVKSLPQHNVGLRGWVGTKGPMLYTLGPWFLWNLVVQFSLVHIFKK